MLATIRFFQMPMLELPDEDLMRDDGEVRAREAFTVLYERYRAPIYGFLLKRLGSAMLAAEAQQKAWERVWGAGGAFDPSRTFRPWLFGVARHAAQEESRGQRRYDARLFRFADEAEEPDLRDDAAPRARLRVQVVEALERLPERYRDALLLSCEGLPGEEAAESLGIQHGAWRMLLSRAREAFTELLGDWDDGQHT